MEDTIRWVGIDAHKDSLSVAVLEGYASKATVWTVENTDASVKRLAKRLVKDGQVEVRACYEAGPTGYQLQHALGAAGIVCEVVAPALIPKKAGARIKTDRRDAKKLAELLRAGLLTEVRPPTPRGGGSSRSMSSAPFDERRSHEVPEPAEDVLVAAQPDHTRSQSLDQGSS